MHIPDGFINGATAVSTGAVSAGAVAASLRQGRRHLADRQVPLVGLAAAFIFAAQMVNFPIAFGTSGHLLGGALAAILVGPWMGCVVLAVVLLVQAIGFGDGGVTALGANIALMGIVAGIGGHYLFRGLLRLLPRTRGGYLTAAGVTAWTTVVAASLVATLFITVGGPFAGQFGQVLVAMLGFHTLIGVGEAAITVAVAGAVLTARPDLLANADLLPPRAVTVTAT